MLQFDYQDAGGGVITAVFGEPQGRNWWRVAIHIGERMLLLSVDEDTDQIEATLEPVAVGGDWRPIHALDPIVGRSLGWCWVGRNSQGYLDMFSLGFDGIEPEVLFLAEASALRLKRISDIG
ncbi:MAG: DUF6334 family protein [Caulobacter sp.]|nr:DUF6334 family protein [Caulobacter sp.]